MPLRRVRLLFHGWRAIAAELSCHDPGQQQRNTRRQRDFGAMLPRPADRALNHRNGHVEPQNQLFAKHLAAACRDTRLGGPALLDHVELRLARRHVAWRRRGRGTHAEQSTGCLSRWLGLGLGQLGHRASPGLGLLAVVIELPLQECVGTVC